MGLLLLGAAAAEAQTSRILVSNSAQTDDDSANTSGNDHAQLFHTGNHTNGYTLRSVQINSDDNEGDDFDVEVCEEDGTANEFPSTTAGDCTALTALTGSTFTGIVTFTHTGLALAANTNYVVVIKQIGTGSVELNSTTSGGEDAQGLSDWSIKNKFYWKSGSTWMLKSGSDEALRIIVNGFAGLSVGDATDATLSALSVSGATLSPAFGAATTTPEQYLAVVANAVTQGTITATTSETTATVEYLDGSDATRTDADTMTAGLQVNLSVGTNTVKVKVTAPDTTTTETYIVSTCSRRRSRRVQRRVDDEPDLDGKPDRGNAECASSGTAVTAKHSQWVVRYGSLDNDSVQLQQQRRTAIEGKRFVDSDPNLSQDELHARRLLSNSATDAATISCLHIGTDSVRFGGRHYSAPVQHV